MIIGIDPGISGAIAAVTRSGSLQWVRDMPIRSAEKKNRNANEIDGIGLARILRVQLADIDEVWIEEVASMPAQGVASVFSLGDSRGCIRGVCEALGLSVQRVHPKTWKKSYGLGSDKPASIACAQRLYPGIDVLERKKDHGRAEAILLARYGAQQSRLGDSFLGESRPSLELVA